LNPPEISIAFGLNQNVLFERGGCRCADMVVAVVRKGWLPLFGNSGLQMPFAIIADGICNHRRWHLRLLQVAFAHHLFRTSFTTTSEHRPPGFSNIVHHPFRRPPAAASNAGGTTAVSGGRIARTLYVVFGFVDNYYLPVYQCFNQSFLLLLPPLFPSFAACGDIYSQTLFSTLPNLNFGMQGYVFLFKQGKSFFLKVISF